jgi:integrase
MAQEVALPCTDDLTTQLFTLAEARRILDAPVLDKSYRLTSLGPDIVDWLAWLELGGTAERTLDQYERDLARGCLMFPDVPLAEFGDSHMAQVAKAFKPAERRVRVAAWKSFFGWAVRTRRIVAKPTDALPVIKRRPQKVYDLFTAAECEALCGLPARDGALMTLMLSAGPRKGDCQAFQLLHWRPEATVDAPYGTVRFLKGKGGKDRLVPAIEPVARALAELSILDGVGERDYLWYTRPGGGQMIERSKPIGAGSFDRWWGRCLAAAGVRERNPHMTRHTFATSYLRNGGRLETLQLILGHASIQTTSDLYGHLDMRDVALDLGLLSRL